MIQRSPLLAALPYIAWLQALLAMTGSLFFSEVLKYPPCVLCWYQRIAMYPLVLLLGIAIARHEIRQVSIYAVPLSIIGWLIACYHVLLYYQILPESAAPCMLGVSCTTHLVEWFGILTIPLLSLLAFTVIILCLTIHLLRSRPYESLNTHS